MPQTRTRTTGGSRTTPSLTCSICRTRAEGRRTTAALERALESAAGWASVGDGHICGACRIVTGAAEVAP